MLVWRMSVFILQKYFFSQELYLKRKHSHFISYLEFIPVLQEAQVSSVPQIAWQELRGSSFAQTPDPEHFCSYGKRNTSGYKTDPHWLCFPR